MIDALLLAALDTVRGANFGWDEKTSDVMQDGHPAPRCGDWFLAFHAGGESGNMMNALDEYYDFTLTLTRRISGVPVDRRGDQILFSRNVRTLAKETGFSARAQQLKTFLHMNWYVIGIANDYLVQMYSGVQYVNGFCEPMHWQDTHEPKAVGGEWFASEPNARDSGIITEIRFAGARRLQAMATFE